MTKKETKDLFLVVIFFLLLAIGFYIARLEQKLEAEQVRTACVRESYIMAKKHGGTPREWERECLQHRTEEALDRIDMQHE